MLSDYEYLYICDLCKKITGITIDLSKKYLIDSRLSKFVHVHKFESERELINTLQKGPLTSVHQKVAYSLLTHETLFFRDGKHFNTLATHILPKFTEHESLTIWSAACSTGQEPYSIAMSISELFSPLQSAKMNVIASDIADDVIDFAKKGIYTKALLSRGVEPTILNKYFRKINDEEWEITDIIKKKITFKKNNLMDNFWALPSIQVVFIRNVLIYFKTEERMKILNTMKKYLEDGGIVITGTGEDISNLDKSFVKKNIDGVIYFEFNKWPNAI